MSTNSVTALKERQSTDSNQGLTDWLEVSRPTRHKICHFEDVLPGQSLGLVLKNENKQQKQTCIHNEIYYNIKLTHKKKSIRKDKMKWRKKLSKHTTFIQHENQHESQRITAPESIWGHQPDKITNWPHLPLGSCENGEWTHSYLPHADLQCLQAIFFKKAHG